MNVMNEMVKEILMEIPEGHKHIRTRIVLQDNSEIIFQEATVATMTRAYITLKTHPQKTSVRLTGCNLPDKKQGFADWQLMEE